MVASPTAAAADAARKAAADVTFMGGVPPAYTGPGKEDRDLGVSDIIAAMSTQTGRSTVVLRGHLYKVGVLQDGRMSIDPIDPVKDSQAARAWTLWPEFLDLELCVLIYVLFFVVFALWRPAWLGDLNQWLRRTWAR